MNHVRHFEEIVHRSPDNLALLHQDRSYSYAELDGLASRFASALRRRGLKRGDRAAILLPNSTEFMVAYLGMQKAGCIPVSVSALLKPQELGFILHDCGARLLVTLSGHLSRLSAEHLSLLEHIVTSDSSASKAATTMTGFLEEGEDSFLAEDLPDSHGAAIVYSSATTGFPKGVLLSHGNLNFVSRSKRRYCGIRPEDRLLLFLPLSHCFGQNAVMNPALFTGAALVLHRQFDVDSILKSVARDAVTMFFAVPTIYGQLLERAPASAFQSVRYFFSAADTLPARVARAWQEKFSIPIHEGYGLSESTPFACYNHELSYRLGSIGAPIEQVEMRIADPENGHELPAGETGEILIRGPNVMLGYWNRPQETADTVRDGWLRTGDLGSMDGDGYFYIVDRLKDMINVGGLKAFPAEVEQALCQYPGVSEAAVFGVPDPISGERVCARVVLQPEASVTAEALRAHCRQRVADFKVPAEIGFVKSLPKTGSGKVLRRELRAAAAVREQEASKLTQQSAGLAR